MAKMKFNLIASLFLLTFLALAQALTYDTTYASTHASTSSTSTPNSSTQHGSFCNPIQGCNHTSLTCVKNVCECAPGYEKSPTSEDKCDFIGCESNTDCQQDLDPNRRCNTTTKQCDRCKTGLKLDPVVNRCVTLLGYECAHTSECWYFGSSSNTSTMDYDSMPICRSGRCVCPTDYFPNADWSQCELRICSSHEECNPFGDDPYRFCSKTSRRCLCRMGYYENSRHSVCLPYIPVQYSLMLPFWLTLIMFTMCILVYISRRLARARAAANAEAMASSEESAAIPHALNLPPPSYDTVTKEPTSDSTGHSESQPPTYATLPIQQA